MLTFASPEQELLYEHLIREYRCLKCQNQNIADSHADLAEDLRNEVHEQILTGKTENEITAYLVARYGDFILYRPPFKAITYVLWIGPFCLLILALWFAVRLARKDHRVVINGKQLENVKRLLDE